MECEIHSVTRGNTLVPVSLLVQGKFEERICSGENKQAVWHRQSLWESAGHLLGSEEARYLVPLTRGQPENKVCGHYTAGGESHPSCGRLRLVPPLAGTVRIPWHQASSLFKHRRVNEYAALILVGYWLITHPSLRKTILFLPSSQKMDLGKISDFCNMHNHFVRGVLAYAVRVCGIWSQCQASNSSSAEFYDHQHVSISELPSIHL